jgi:LPXTG-motif cell wall-anchored protein
VFRKISLALVLASMAGMASASNAGSGDKCFTIAWFTFCSPEQPAPVKAPEIDPASAMAGLTMLAGGLAVLRGRRRKNSQE